MSNPTVPAHQLDTETYCVGCHAYRSYREGFFADGVFWCSTLCQERAGMSDEEWMSQSTIGNQCYDRG